jgi:hypothetical protein
VRLAPEEHVRGRVERVDQLELLWMMAMPSRPASAGRADRPARRRRRCARVGAMDAGEIFISVDLPAPFSPTSPTISPAHVEVHASSATTPGNRFEIRRHLQQRTGRQW